MHHPVSQGALEELAPVAGALCSALCVSACAGMLRLPLCWAPTVEPWTVMGLETAPVPTSR